MCHAAARPRRAFETPQPRWSILYSLAFFMLGAVVTVEIAPLPAAWQTGLGCGLGFGGFAAMAGWVRRNRAALDQQDWCACAAEKITVRVIPSRRSEPERSEAPAFEEIEDETLVVGAGRR